MMDACRLSGPPTRRLLPHQKSFQRVGTEIHQDALCHEDQRYKVPSDVVPHRMVLYTAGLHGRAHPGEFPSQPVENSFDAGATDVWAVLKGGKHPSLTVIDNGSGMLPDILPEDHKRLEKHLADLRDPEKEIPEDFDIFKEISEASLHSLMWMIR